MCPLPVSVIVVFVTIGTIEGEEEEEMNHYMDFDPYVIRERNQQLHTEVRSIRLEEQLLEERGSSGSRFVALAKRGMRPLLRKVHHAG
jgi:hypothetical protein